MTGVSTHIGSYEYNYTTGLGIKPNRRIDFSRTSSPGSTTIQAIVSTRDPNTHALGAQIATIPETAITVELESTTQQTNRLYARKFLSVSDYNSSFGTPPQDRCISSDASGQQDTIMESLASGTRKIQPIINGSTGAHEIVTGLKIYDPN